MRWTRHTPGDVRTIRRYAWLPVRVGQETIWLEHYHAREVFTVGWEWEGWEIVSATITPQSGVDA